MVARPWCSSRLSCGKRLLLRCDGNAGNSFPTTQGRDPSNTGEESTIACDGVFVSVGRKPATEFLGDQVTLDGGGYVVAGEDTKTKISGVFAVGDIRTKELRQIVTAVADGAVAVHEAEKHLAGGA